MTNVDVFVVRLDWIELKTTTLERERVGVTPIVKKMVETRLGWFGHVERRLADSVVRRVGQMEGSQITRGRGRPRKTNRETIKKDLWFFLEHYGVVDSCSRPHVVG